MEYHTPGVYIREVDSGPKPIASVATSIPGFIGLFPFKPEHDAISITGSDGRRQIRGKVIPQLVDTQGQIKGNADEAAAALTEAFRLRRGQVRDIKKYLELHGTPASGKNALKIEPGPKGKVNITASGQTVTVAEVIMDVTGKVVTENDQLVEDLLNQLHENLALSAPKPKTAGDVLAVYGYEFQGAQGTALRSEYSIPPVAVTNKGEFFRWLQSFFAQYLIETRPLEDLIGQNIDDPDDAADAVYEALSRDEALKQEFRKFLSQPNAFSFVSAVNGFYDNGGGKAYVYLMGVQNLECSIRENQADKLGLYAFDDADDIALMAAPGTSPQQQKEMLEYCETRKDRFAILDGPMVSDGAMDIPASEKGYGALYVPWFRVTKPSWFSGEQDISVKGPNRRKLIKTTKNELYVPPSGHVAGIMARVDTERGVHKAPANELVMGITGLTQNINRIEQA
ncbi:MAG: hypothetical protein ACI8S6_003896, partial [Myxococcota bacterium]